ncbi:MAG: tetratricopeptide repeat protein [Deltaproteobacteria bacterium]|nr:tetratricopeptide repeat protein [Deltaproteobacteria bacterium]
MTQRIRKKRETSEKKVSISSGGENVPRKWPVIVLLAILCILLYGNSLQNDFAFDDKPLIVKNKAIRSLGNIPDILGISDPKNFIRGLIGGVNYRPIRVVSFTIDYFFSGSSPVAFHVFNILYHFLTAWVVFLVVMRLITAPAGLITPSGGESKLLAFRTALFTAILFAVHPIQTNAVTYISGRRDVLSTLFYMLGLLYFLKLREAQYKENKVGKDARVAYFALVCMFFLLAVMTKEMALSLPAIFFVIDFMREFPKQSGSNVWTDILRSSGRVIYRHRYFYYPFIFISLLTGMYYIFFRGASNRIIAGWQWWGDSALNNFLTVATILVFYIKLLIFPVVLSADYSYNAYPVAQSPWELRVLLSLAVLLVLAIMAVRWLRRSRLMAFGWIWFFVTLLPVSQIIPHHELLAEHYLYLPSIGFFMLLGLIIATRISNASGNRGVLFFIYAVPVLLVVIWSGRTIIRNPDWRSDKVLWAKTVRTVPQSFRAQFNMGNLLRQEGSPYGALDYFNRALKIKPDDARALLNIGAIYDRLGLRDKAFEHYQRSLTADPEYAAACNNIGGFYIRRGEIDKAIYYLTKATRLLSNFVEARMNLAIAYGKKYYTEEALKHFDIALEMDPENARIYYYRGVFFASIGEVALAKRDMRLALLHDPNYPLPHLNLGEMYVNEEKMDEAAREFQDVLRLEPRIPQAHVNLGSIYASQGKVGQAIYHFRTALDIDPNQAAAHKGMGIIYLTSLQDLDGAVSHFRRSLELDPTQEGADSIREFLANPRLALPQGTGEGVPGVTYKTVPKKR